MSNVTMGKEYVVLALSPDYSSKKLIQVLKCGYSAIKSYVKTLSFGDSVELCFFDIDKLNEEEAMTWQNSGVESIVMDNNKSFSEFDSQLSAMLDRLEIKKEKEIDAEK